MELVVIFALALFAFFCGKLSKITGAIADELEQAAKADEETRNG